MLKITKKINHDNLWLKVQDPKTKSYAKVLVSRSGIRASLKATEEQNAEFKGIAKEMFEHMKNCGDLTHGQALEDLEIKMENWSK